jgi:hypothetical protein
MSLATLMIGATFVLGVLLLLTGCAAVLRGGARGGGGGGGGTFKVAGIEVTGKNGATMILVIGAAFVASGFGWASTQQEAKDEHAKATVAGEQAQTFRGVAERTQSELIKADGALEENEKQRAALHASLKAAVTPEKLNELERTTPLLKAGRTWKPPAELMRPIGALHSVGG